MRQIRVRACYGGHWGHGANAGLFYAYVGNAPSYSGSNIGCRLAKDGFGQMPARPRGAGQRLSFGARILSQWLEDQQPRTASSLGERGARPYSCW